MSFQVTFGPEYQNIFTQALKKVNQQNIINFTKGTHHRNTNNNFYTPANKPTIKKSIKNQEQRDIDLSQSQRVKQKKYIDSINKGESHKNQQMSKKNAPLSSQQMNVNQRGHQDNVKALKQTMYHTFGQKSKSFDFKKTFVNLSNTRYQINKNKIYNDQGESLKQSMLYSNINNLQKNAFVINNLAFPIINQTKKSCKHSSFYIKTKSPPNITNQTCSQLISKRKNSRIARSLQLNKSLNLSLNPELNNQHIQSKVRSINKIKNLPIYFSSTTNQQNNLFKDYSNYHTKSKQRGHEDQKFKLSLQQIQKRLKLKTNEYLKEIAFSKQLQLKAQQIQRNITLNKKIPKNKIVTNQASQNIQKEKISAWKHEITQQNNSYQPFDVFYNIKNKSSF